MTTTNTDTLFEMDWTIEDILKNDNMSETQIGHLAADIFVGDVKIEEYQMIVRESTSPLVRANAQRVIDRFLKGGQEKK